MHTWQTAGGSLCSESGHFVAAFKQYVEMSVSFNPLFAELFRKQNYVSVFYIDGLVQERCNSSAWAMELRLSCINP